jgi:copper homeostasis protein CutC
MLFSFQILNKIDAHPTIGGLNLRSLNAFETTVTDEKAMAAAARIGSRRILKKGKRTPAATGIKTVL